MYIRIIYRYCTQKRISNKSNELANESKTEHNGLKKVQSSDNKRPIQDEGPLSATAKTLAFDRHFTQLEEIQTENGQVCTVLAFCHD